MSRSVPPILLMLLTASAAVSLHSQTPPSFVPLFEALHQDPTATPPLSAWTPSASAASGNLKALFERESERWMAAGSPGEHDRRRAIAATVALMTVNRIEPRSWRAAAALLESACALLRRAPAPTDAERLWYRASNALLQASGDVRAAELHASHGLNRFPHDARLVMGRALATELRIWPDDGRRPQDADGRTADLIVRRLEEALTHDETRAEALVRLGMLALRNTYADQAVAHLRKVPGHTSNPSVLYLAALFEGRAEERRGRADAAIAAYRRAVVALPGTQTAALALGAMLVRQGDLEAGARIVREAVAAGEPVDDPWLTYPQGDLRIWSALR